MICHAMLHFVLPLSRPLSMGVHRVYIVGLHTACQTAGRLLLGASMQLATGPVTARTKTAQLL
jgi:hypothetical protein